MKQRDCKNQGKIYIIERQTVYNERVAGVLSVTRSFGDTAFQNKGLIQQPYINKQVLRVIHKLVVIATDGLWDYVTEEEALLTIKAF